MKKMEKWLVQILTADIFFEIPTGEEVATKEENNLLSYCKIQAPVNSLTGAYSFINL